MGDKMEISRDFGNDASEASQISWPICLSPGSLVADEVWKRLT